MDNGTKVRFNKEDLFTPTRGGYSIPAKLRSINWNSDKLNTAFSEACGDLCNVKCTKEYLTSKAEKMEELATALVLLENNDSYSPAELRATLVDASDKLSLDTTFAVNCRVYFGDCPYHLYQAWQWYAEGIKQDEEYAAAYALWNLIYDDPITEYAQYMSSPDYYDPNILDHATNMDGFRIKSGKEMSTCVRMSDIIASLDKWKDSDQGVPVEVPLTGAVLTASDAYKAEAGTDGTIHAYCMLSDIIDFVSNNKEAIVAANISLDSIKEDILGGETIQSASNLVSNIITKFGDTSSIVMELVDRCAGAIKDSGLPVIDKVKSVLNALGVYNDNSQAEDVVTGFDNQMSDMTGASPLSLFGDSIVDVATAVPWNSVGNAIVGVCKGIRKGVGAAFSAVGAKIKSGLHKIVSSTVAPDDFYIVSKSEDPVVQNLAFNFILPVGGSFPSDSWRKLSTNNYLVMPFGSSKVYLWAEDDGNGGYRYRGAIKFSPIRGGVGGSHGYGEIWQAYYDWCWDNGDSNQEATDQLIDPVIWDLEYNSFWDSSDSTDPTTDESAYTGLIQCKRSFLFILFYMLCTVKPPIWARRFWGSDPSLDADTLDGLLIGNSNASSILEACGVPQSETCDATSMAEFYPFKRVCINRTSPSNPSNSAFANEFVSFLSFNTGAGAYQIPASFEYPPVNQSEIDGNIMCLFAGLLYCVLNNDWRVDWNIDLSDKCFTSFVPYYHDTTIYDGRYAIKTDSANCKAYEALFGTFVITAAVVLVAVVAHKIKKKARAKKLKLESEKATQNYNFQEELGGNKDGDPTTIAKLLNIDPSEVDITNKKQMLQASAALDKMNRKRDRKIRRLEKLAGLKPATEAIQSVSSNQLSGGKGAATNTEVDLESIILQSIVGDVTKGI